MIERGVWFAASLLLLYAPALFGQVVVPDSVQTITVDSLVRKIDSTDVVVIAADTIIAPASKNKPKFIPNPKKAIRISLLTPVLGGGQIYNRDYWKLPFVYGAYGASLYFIILNVDRYQTMVGHYKEFYILDESNPNFGKLNPDVKTVDVYNKSQNRYIPMTIDNVRRAKDTYRRWRDWSYFAIAATYAMAAIEANVAAHLKTFDLSEDLTMRIQPTVTSPGPTTLTPGVKLVFAFK